jgi:hypothetical protein
LHGHFQNFGEIQQRFVVDVRETRFDLGNTASADIETGKLELGRKSGPAEAPNISWDGPVPCPFCLS